ncbi:MAG: carboxy terminal-processing peptidase, partial [Puniceicoccales bacterium]|nr:carboxy terminal-processing peptidase [Puniceicoccales bacterium]
IRLPAFYGANENDIHSDSYADVKELLLKLSEYDVQGIVFDLRGNSGGLLEEAISIAGFFIGKGPVVQVRSGDGQVQIFQNTNVETTYGGPLVILTSKRSISASEILAGALRDYNRAIIIGDKTTYGKGSVQTILPMNQTLLLFSKNIPKLGAARITLQKWYLPSGESIQRRGVPAHISLPSVNDYLPIGEEDYKHSLPWDCIGEAEGNWKEQWKNFHYPVNESLVNDLLEKSLQRRQIPEWKLYEEYVQHFRDHVEQKEFSLQLEERRQKMAEDTAFREYIKEELGKLAPEAYKKTDIFLDVSRSPRKEQENDGGPEEGFSNFDIYLREALRVLSDWVQFVPGKE